jgi:luciferase family oxidoreductase group 1
MVPSWNRPFLNRIPGVNPSETFMNLSVLDQSPISEGSTGVDALRNTIDLARLVDGLGYHRYWVSEHHGTPMLAGPSPEALIGPIAAATSRLRVGSGGVMLPHYSPFKVAESFSLLAGLFPGRIDLAVGRASGTDPTTAFALQRDRRHPLGDDFPQQLAELLSYLSDTLPPHHPFARLSATLPGLPESPEPWLLGSSPQSGIWAAELGLPYAFADFISPDGVEIVARYRESFIPSRWVAEPRSMVAVWVVCAETDDEARRIASSSTMAFTLLQRGELIPVPPIERALRFLAEQPPRTGIGQRARRRIVGSPSTVRAGLEAVAAEYGTDEVMVVTITFDHADRRRSYELIAEAFDLPHRNAEDTIQTADTLAG